MAAGGGAFSDPHQDGDILVLSHFTNGGSQPQIEVYQWNGPGGSIPGQGTVNNTLDKLTSATNIANCADPLINTKTACSITNEGTLSGVPWPFTPKQGAAQTYGANQFFEGAVNVTQLLGTGNTPCFSTFLAETRTSASVGSQLKDFALGEFALCGAKISIAQDGVNAAGVNHTFTATAKRTIAGIDTPAPDGTVVTATIASDTTGAAHFVPSGTTTTCTTSGGTGTCQVTVVSPNPGVVTVSASATVVIGNDSFTVSTDGQGGSSGPATKRFVDAKIALSPLTDTNGVTENHTITATVQQDDGLPAPPPACATPPGCDSTTGFGPASGVLVTVSLTNSNGSTAAFLPAGVNTCTTGATGTCTVTITSPTAGTVTLHATTTLSVGGVSLTRATGPGVATVAGDDVQKVFVAGTLVWLKRDQAGQPLGGATFEVCRTHNFNSTTNVFDDVADVCVNAPAGVTDNVAPDEDPAAGQLKLSGLILGRYTIKETAAPPGYGIDPDTETVELTVTNPSNAANPPVFVNTLLLKLLLITCNQADNAVINSSVTAFNPLAGNTVPQPTLTGAADALVVSLCQAAVNATTNPNGSAEFFNLPDAVYTITVDVKNP